MGRVMWVIFVSKSSICGFDTWWVVYFLLTLRLHEKDSCKALRADTFYGIWTIP